MQCTKHILNNQQPYNLGQAKSKKKMIKFTLKISSNTVSCKMGSVFVCIVVSKNRVNSVPVQFTEFEADMVVAYIESSISGSLLMTVQEIDHVY